MPVKNIKFAVSIAAYILFLFIFSNCRKTAVKPPFFIEGISTANFPVIDGSTSTAPLQNLIACRLLGFPYSWEQMLFSDNTWNIIPKNGVIPENFKFWDHVKTSQTHNSFLNIIDKTSDMALTARKMSPDEKAYAAAKGVTLIETPIALDAFIFIMNPKNPVKSLTTKQVQDIYTGKITNWKEVGGADNIIKPYVRNANSGSQELMESLVMKDVKIATFPVEIVSSMMLAFGSVRYDVNGLCYTVYYYKENMVRENLMVKHIAIDGVYPDKATITNKSYPYTTEVYAVVRSDLDKNSMGYKLYELLQTQAGKNIIAESGYIPN